MLHVYVIIIIIIIIIECQVIQCTVYMYDEMRYGRNFGGAVGKSVQ